jgi:serine phosphatase RsbU (regulator of sigma subunit)
MAYTCMGVIVFTVQRCIGCPATMNKDFIIPAPPDFAVLPRGDTLGSPIRVLLVDDDQWALDLLRIRLQAVGYLVHTVDSGEAAIEYLQDEAADLVVLDVQLPGLSGMHVLEHVLDINPDLLVIISSVYSSEEILVDALRRGAYDYLRKPVQARDLRLILGRVVRTLALERENKALQLQLEEKRMRLEAELSRAAQVQADLLPAHVPDLAGYDLAACCVPAREVGGDFYDWMLPADGLLNLVFGDVMGKGMPAALLMTTVRAVIRSTIRAVAPEINISYAASVLDPDLDRANSFVTLFHAQLELASGSVRFVDCGHGCAFVQRASGEVVEELEPRGVPLGLPRNEPLMQGTLQLDPGDMLIIYSDGLLDARNELLIEGNHGISARIRGTTAHEVVRQIIAYAQLDGPPPDDLTVMVLKRQP